jgi:hypothetical protein
MMMQKHVIAIFSLKSAANGFMIWDIRVLDVNEAL